MKETVVSGIVFAGDVPPATIADRVRRAQMVRLATGVYTTDVDTGPERVTSREWHTIVGRLYPDAVITDRSAMLSSEDKKIAQVVGEGAIMGLDPGTTTINVQVDGARASFQVIVEADKQKK